MAFDSVLIHSCIIYRKVPDASGNTDAYGQPIYTELPATYKCRFFKMSRYNRYSGKIASRDLEYFSVPLSVMLPNGVDISKDDRLTTSITGYSGTYTIEDLNPIYGRSMIHHYVANLLKVET